MIEILGEMYYIDFNELDKFMTIDDISERKKTKTKEFFDENGKIIRTEEINTSEDKPKEINGVRFELIRGFIFDLGLEGSEVEDMDEKLAYNNLEKLSIKFKIAYNTLVFYKILKKID